MYLIKFTTCTRLTPIVVYGGVPYTPQARQVERGVDIIIATPGRHLEYYFLIRCIEFVSTKFN